MKLSKTAWAHTDGGQDDDGQLLAVAIDVLQVEPAFPQCGAQYLPAGLIGQIDIQDDEIKRGGAQVRQRCLSIFGDAYFMLAHGEIACQ